MAISRPGNARLETLLHHPIHDFGNDDVFPEAFFLEQFEGADRWTWVSGR